MARTNYFCHAEKQRTSAVTDVNPSCTLWSTSARTHTLTPPMDPALTLGSGSGSGSGARAVPPTTTGKDDVNESNNSPTTFEDLVDEDEVNECAPPPDRLYPGGG